MAPRFSIFDYEDEILPTARSLEIDPTAAFNLGETESAGNPYAVSPVGAGGLFQLMPGTAREMGVSDVFNPSQNIKGGLGYFDKMGDMFDSPIAGTAAYNYGPGNLQDLAKREGTTDIAELYDDLPKETRNHLYKVWHPSSDPQNDAWLRMRDPENPDFVGGGGVSSSGGGRSMPSALSQGIPDYPTYSKRREQNLDRVNTDISTLEGQRMEALEGLKNQGQLETNDAIAMALTAILPTLLGFGFGGGLKGAAVGAQAGAAGANVGLQGLTQQMTRRDDLNKTILNLTNQQIASRESERRGIEDNMAGAEELGQRAAFNAEMISGRQQFSRGPQQLPPELASAVTAYVSGSATPAQEELIASNPAALRLANDTLKAKTYAQGGARYSDLAAQGLSDIRAGREPSPDAMSEIMRNPRAVDDMEQMRRRDDAVSRTNANIELRGRIPTPELAKITGHEVAIKNYGELANLVRGRDFDTQRVGEVFGEFQEELLSRGDQTFTAAGYDGLFNRVLARSGLDPNSYDYQVLQRMAQIGRANAIAQPGVATNQDAEQETRFVSIAPGQTVDTYIQNLTRLANNRSQIIGVTLDNLSINGNKKAEEFKKKYLSSGVLSQGGSTTLDAGGGEGGSGLSWTGKRDAQGRRIMRAQ